MVSWAESSVSGEGPGEVGAAGESGAIGAWWIWGASSARTTNAEIPRALTEAQGRELPVALHTNVAPRCLNRSVIVRWPDLPSANTFQVQQCSRRTSFEWIFATKPWLPARGLSRSLEEVWGGTGFLSLSNELPLGHKQTETCRSGWVLESGSKVGGMFQREQFAPFVCGGAVEMLLNRI